MRRFTVLAIGALSVTTASAVLVVPQVRPAAIKHDQFQRPMAPLDLGPQIPWSPERPKPSAGDTGDNGDLTISDILPAQRQINIFAGLTRDVESLESRLESNSPTQNTTLLAPLNSVMMGLDRKPWEDRPDDDSGVSAQHSEDKAARNLRQFLLQHAVPVSPWEEGQKVRTLWGEAEGDGKDREIWWEHRGGGSDGSEKRRVIMPGEVVVEGVIGRVGNGQVWSLKGVINYE